jgi:aerobic-type carbon monoxide dehydrogenase small subunit (CoxS/CutS family)/carbon monoxide dehydrogenase subunit G
MSGRPVPRPGRVAAHELVEIAMTVNGSEVAVRVPPRIHLADVLREQLGLTGTHLGCEHGVCGMCTVLVNGAAARACLLFAVQCEGAEILTVEGLGSQEDQHPLQEAFSAHHGLQCGFCTPGMLMSSYDLLADGTDVAPEDLPVEMSGVLCRCTGYRGILAAVADVAAEHPDGLPAPRNCRPRTIIGRGAEHPVRGYEAPSTRIHSRPIELPTGAPSATVDVRTELAVRVDAVWEVLDDFHRLAACLPGAELVEVLGDDRYRGRATVALGPVKLAFDGLAHVVEREGHRMRVLAQGADAGGSSTQADIRLRAEPTPEGGTILQADAALFLSGRIAQFGRALAGDVSRRMFEQFAAAVEENARTGKAPTTPVRPPSVLALLAATAGARLRAVLRRFRGSR